MSSTVFRSDTALQAYRIGSRDHPLLDGGGAARSDDARWNSRGRYVIYAAEHYATAVLEKAAQLNSVRIPRTLGFIQIDVVAGATVEEVRADDLAGWDRDDKDVSRRFGDDWYDAGRSLILLVPSLAAPGLAARGATPPLHRERRGARLARRDDREYREYLRKEQRSQLGCIAVRMQMAGHYGLLERNVLINQRHREFTKVTAGRPRAISCHPRLLL